MQTFYLTSDDIVNALAQYLVDEGKLEVVQGMMSFTSDGEDTYRIEIYNNEQIN